MTSDEIRESFLSYFEQRDHKRLQSASLVPASYDPSVLLTTAGMHPLKPYFQGLEAPPHHRLTSCQKCFRTPDIDVVGTTTRHLTFFEMLGNFSLGDYFKEGAAEFAWELSLNGFGFDPKRIWVTVFEGDEELGLGPDEEAIAVWEKIGVPRERIVLCPRSENFWQAGETGPCGPCSELYYDRGLEWGTEDDLPGGENERFLEYWNLVFMQYNQDPVGTLTPLPNQNIDTGLGLNRMALIQQGVDSIFDTDQFVPLMELGRSLARNEIDERALRILADHSRGMTFMIADGVVPSNEDRGYVLRRLMRRAIAQGHRLGFEGEFLPKYVDVVMATMGAAYPELARERDAILRWVTAEEQGFGRTLETGLAMLDELLARGAVSGEDAFKLHDTFGFPIDLTVEIAGEREVPVDIADFDTRMEEQRLRSSAGAGTQERVGAKQEVIRQLSEEPTEFTGYEHLEERTTVAGVLEQGGRIFVKLGSSPFYAQGGGQVSDTGVVETEDGAFRATVNEVLRSGEDQAVVLEGDGPTHPSLKAGEKVVARVDRAARQATQANHTATHLLHAALREALGTHVRQAGSYVGPDKLRFDFTHGTRLSSEEVTQVEDRVNGWILANDPVRPITTTLKEAQELGAMALFGEKYGDVVRMVQIGGGEYSRELCGGTHVRATAEIGVFRIVSEGSSASNVRRIEAVTGPEAVTLLRSHDALIREAAGELRTSPEQVPAKVADLQAQLKAAAKAHSFGSNGAVDVDALAGQADELSGVRVLTTTVAVPDAKALLDATDRIKNVLGDAAIVLGAVTDGKVALIASVAPSLVARGIKAGELVKVAAQVVGGGGGGRDTMAQAGGRDPEKLDDALAAARAHIENALAS
ncbi:alanine--tRNA ligase [Baekduia sp.]|uniref:alanine--tRNA ligase n=1 Tax=Baekduia sp. TaxID=2600305 RepID=UPI002E0C9225|nr:alanine--tRNA ligase [Baekduia sp.]